MYLFNSFIIILMNLILILLSVAFLTLLELKILSYIQLLKGPNKVSFIGLLQPFSDAIKLFNKENSLILKSNYYMYLFSPIMSMMIMMLIWLILPIYSNLYSMSLMILYMISILSMGVYSMMMSGWSSNSMYSLIGSLLSVAQTISYEVSMIFIMMSVLLLIENFLVYDFLKFQKFLMMLFMLIPISYIFMVSMLAELNLTPFDFSEGESELVSGFNVEYMSGLFAMIFISEYGMILFMSYLYLILFMKSDFMNLLFYLKFLLLYSIVIWILGSFPLFLYDKLMYLTWKFYLMVSMNYVIIIMIFKF